MANPTSDVSMMADENDNGIITNQQAIVSDASVAHALNATFSDTEVEAALNALGTKINAVLDILEAHGLMADA
jgi:hypothetical protein